LTTARVIKTAIPSEPISVATLASICVDRHMATLLRSAAGQSGLPIHLGQCARRQQEIRGEEHLAVGREARSARV
jgi:hypothetical protein